MSLGQRWFSVLHGLGSLDIWGLLSRPANRPGRAATGGEEKNKRQPGWATIFLFYIKSKLKHGYIFEMACGSKNNNFLEIVFK